MIKLAIDFGDGVTKIYMPGCGVVLTEATCVAVEKVDELGWSVKAYGNKARALSGRAAQNTRIVNPLAEGDIVNEQLATELLSYFLDKVELPASKRRRAEVIFLLPCGYKKELKQKYMNISANLGLGAVYYTILPFAAILGQGESISDVRPVLSLDIGAGITNIAALSRDGIISGLSVNLGSGNIDVHLMDELAENFDLKIGALTAERLKNTVGSLLPDDNKMTVADGRSVSTGAPSSVAINSENLLEIIKIYVDKILEYVTLVIKKLPAEVASSIMHGGVYLTGGIVKMDGLKEYIGEKLKMPVNVSEEPQLAAVIGAGAILADYDLLKTFASIY